MTTLPTIRHHLNDALLMGYAAGHLSEAFGLVVATHVTMCDDCRARLESFEALGGAVIEAEDETAVSTDALARMMARLEVPVVSAPPKAPLKNSIICRNSVTSIYSISRIAMRSYCRFTFVSPTLI